jgi:hypothetical protein
MNQRLGVRMDWEDLMPSVSILTFGCPRTNVRGLHHDGLEVRQWCKNGVEVLCA